MDLLTNSPLHRMEKSVRHVFNVMVLYDSLAAGQRAIQLFTHLPDARSTDLEFRPLIWRFDLVADRNWCERLNEDGFCADLVIISATDRGDLPRALTNWLRTCLGRKKGTNAGVVALLGEDGHMDPSSSPRLQFLRYLVTSAGLAFFAPDPADAARSTRTVTISPTWSPEKAFRGEAIPIRQRVNLQYESKQGLARGAGERHVESKGNPEWSSFGAKPRLVSKTLEKLNR
jgi:hypothetical protein